MIPAQVTERPISRRAAPPAYWHLEDLAGIGDLAAELGVGKATVSNWTTRYLDFPKPLVELSSGPVYSLWQVRQWHDSREWKADREHQRPRPS